MKINKILEFLTVSLFLIGNCFGSDIEIHNATNENLVIMFLDKNPHKDVRDKAVIISNKELNKDQRVNANFPGLVSSSKHAQYTLIIKDTNGDDRAIFDIVNVSNKNNIFVDITALGNHGYNVTPYINNKQNRERLGKDALNGNIKPINISVVHRFIPRTQIISSNPIH